MRALAKYKQPLKILFALFLLLYIFKLVNIPSLMITLKKANIGLLLLAFVLMIINQLFISNVKWSLILNSYGISLPFKKLCSLYLLGMFFSIFLPGAYSGDVVRAYKVSRSTENPLKGAMSVVIERFTGLIGLLIVCLIALLFIKQAVLNLQIKLFAISFIFSVFIFFLLLFSRNLVRKMSFLLSFFSEGIESKLKEIYESMYLMRDRKIQFGAAILLSIVFQFLVVVINYIIVMSLGIEVPLSFFFLIIPVISLISMLPITLNGIGVRDLSYIGLLGAVGVAKEPAFAVGLIAFSMVMLLSLSGGIIYIREK